MRCSWQEVLRMTALEFCNILAYRRDRNARELDAEKRYINTH